MLFVKGNLLFYSKSVSKWQRSGEHVVQSVQIVDIEDSERKHVFHIYENEFEDYPCHLQGSYRDDHEAFTTFFSPDETHLVVLSDDGYLQELRMWRLGPCNHKLLAKFGHVEEGYSDDDNYVLPGSPGCYCSSWSSDSLKYAEILDDYSILVVFAASDNVHVAGEHLLLKKSDKCLPATYMPLKLAFSPDGLNLFCLFGKRSTKSNLGHQNVQIWSLENGQFLQEIVHEKGLTLTNNSIVVICEGNESHFERNRDTGFYEKSNGIPSASHHETHNDNVNPTVLDSKANQYTETVVHDNNGGWSVQVCHQETGQIKHVLSGIEGPVCKVAFGPSVIVTLSTREIKTNEYDFRLPEVYARGTLRVWDDQTGECVSDLMTSGEIYYRNRRMECDVRFIRNGSALIISDINGTFQMFTLCHGQLQCKLDMDEFQRRKQAAFTFLLCVHQQRTVLGPTTSVVPGQELRSVPPLVAQQIVDRIFCAKTE